MTVTTAIPAASAAAALLLPLSSALSLPCQVVGKSYQTVLDRYICRTQLPRNLGGKSDAKLGDNWGPWSKLMLLHLRQSREGGGCAPAPARWAVGTESSARVHVSVVCHGQVMARLSCWLTPFHTQQQNSCHVILCMQAREPQGQHW